MNWCPFPWRCLSSAAYTWLELLIDWMSCILLSILWKNGKCSVAELQNDGIRRTSLDSFLGSPLVSGTCVVTFRVHSNPLRTSNTTDRTNSHFFSNRACSLQLDYSLRMPQPFLPCALICTYAVGGIYTVTHQLFWLGLPSSHFSDSGSRKGIRSYGPEFGPKFLHAFKIWVSRLRCVIWMDRLIDSVSTILSPL